MSTAQLHLRPLPLTSIIDASLEFAQIAWPKAHVRVDVATSLGRLSFAGNTHELLTNADLAKMRATAEQRRYSTCSQFEIKYEGPNGQNQEHLRYTSPTNAQASIEILGRSFTRGVDLSNLIVDKLNVTDYLDKVDAASPSEARAMLLRERSVADLQAHLDKLGSLLATIAEREQEARRKTEELLQTQFREKEERLEAVRQQREEEDERERKKREEDLQRRVGALQEKEQEFETRNARHVRRDHAKKLDELLNKLQTEQISGLTSSKRVPVLLGMIAMATVSLAIGIAGALHYFADPSWRYAWPFSAGVVGLLGTLLFYAKWSDQWFRQHADNEMATRRYKADMLRASWIAELLSEWAETNHSAPTEVLDVFARNLFTSTTSIPVEHPADAVVSFAKRLQRVDLGKERVTLETRDK
jgi:hypothetical protein